MAQQWPGTPYAADYAPPSVFSAPDADAPPPVTIGGGMTSPPPVFSAPLPNVVREPSPFEAQSPIETQIGQTNDKLRDVQWHEAHPFGTPDNHPGVGGKILHALSVAGNIAGDIFAPNAVDKIPGSQSNMQDKEQTLSQKLQALAQEQSQNEARDAGTAKTTAETAAMPAQEADADALSKATTGHLDAETYAAQHPIPDYELHDTPDGILRVNKKNGSAQMVTVDGKQVGAPIKTMKVQLKINGVPHEVLVNEQTGTPIKDLGESGFKPQVTNINAGEAALDREAKQFGAYHQKSLDASNAQLEKIADARSMINGNAEAQGLGIPKVLTALVGGQGTGVRITQAELTSIAHARGLSGDVEGTLNKWAGKGALSADQQKQLTQIMDDVKVRLQQKQAIASGALDAINGASTREQIIAADKDARKQLGDLESGGGGGAAKDVVYDDKGVGHHYKGTGDRSDPSNYEPVKK